MEVEEDFDREIKVVVLGNGGVGKTSMIRRFCKGVFTDEYKKTIGVDFLEKAQFVDALQEEVRFMLWDTGKRPTLRFELLLVVHRARGGIDSLLARQRASAARV